MKNVDDLIAWKTNAWKDPNMVNWYSQRMVENTGQIKLNNLLETSIIAEYVSGNKVIDIGIGTGRASLPLLKNTEINNSSIVSLNSSKSSSQDEHLSSYILAKDFPVSIAS